VEIVKEIVGIVVWSATLLIDGRALVIRSHRWDPANPLNGRNVTRDGEHAPNRLRRKPNPDLLAGVGRFAPGGFRRVTASAPAYGSPR
jgi:hypothetical protein